MGIEELSFIPPKIEDLTVVIDEIELPQKDIVPTEVKDYFQDLCLACIPLVNSVRRRTNHIHPHLNHDQEVAFTLVELTQLGSLALIVFCVLNLPTNDVFVVAPSVLYALISTLQAIFMLEARYKAHELSVAKHQELETKINNWTKAAINPAESEEE